MKAILLLACIACVSTLIVSCSAAKAPKTGDDTADTIPVAVKDSALLSLDYTKKGTMRGYDFEIHVKTEENGDITLWGMKQNRDSIFTRTMTQDELEALRKIVIEEKMYKYKDHYQPPYEVFDGWSWSFNVNFSGRHNSFSSGGYMQRPEGNGLDRVKEYLVSLLSDDKAKFLREPSNEY